MSRYSKDRRVIANPDGSFSLPSGRDSWTVRKVGGEWRASADHHGYTNPPYHAAKTADDAIALIIGEPK